MTARAQQKSRVPLMLGGGCFLVFLTCVGSCFIEWPPHETSAEVDLPAGAPHRHAKVIIRTRTFQGPLPISPIGGPDAAATVELALDHGPPRQLREDYYKRDWVSFRDLDSGRITLVPAVDGLSWCAGSCERSMHLWFHRGAVVSCEGEVRARPSMASLLSGVVDGNRDCHGDVDELALEWALTQTDGAVDVKLARWLVQPEQGSWSGELRDQVAAHLKPRLADNAEAARVLLDHWASLLARARRDEEYTRLEALTEGLEGRARPSWFMARPRFYPERPIAGRLELWTKDFVQPRLVARFPFDGGLVAFDLDAGVPLQVLILADGAEPELRDVDARGAQLGDVTLRPLSWTLEVEVTRAGARLAGADVALSSRNLVKLAGPVVTARTNAAGVARLSPVASSDAIVLVRAPDGACAMFEQPVSYSNDHKARRAVDFATLRAYRGQVLGPDGLPRAGVKVLARPSLSVPGAECVTRRATSDENGEFTFEGIPDVTSIDVFLESRSGRLEPLGTRSPRDERAFASAFAAYAVACKLRWQGAVSGSYYYRANQRAFPPDFTPRLGSLGLGRFFHPDGQPGPLAFHEPLLARVHDVTPVRCATRFEDDGLFVAQGLRSAHGRAVGLVVSNLAAAPRLVEVRVGRPIRAATLVRLALDGLRTEAATDLARLEIPPLATAWLRAELA